MTIQFSLILRTCEQLTVYRNLFKFHKKKKSKKISNCCHIKINASPDKYKIRGIKSLGFLRRRANRVFICNLKVVWRLWIHIWKTHFKSRWDVKYLRTTKKLTPSLSTKVAILPFLLFNILFRQRYILYHLSDE